MGELSKSKQTELQTTKYSKERKNMERVRKIYKTEKQHKYIHKIHTKKRPKNVD